MRSEALQRRLQVALLRLSFTLWVGVSLCYGLRPDACAAVTLWPPWVWLIPGLLLTGLAWNRSARRAVTAVALLWVAFLLLFAEEPRSLARVRPWPAPGWDAARQRGSALRVVSLNCAGGSEEAAAEVARYQPDIVLLQEAPVRPAVERLARQLFGKDAGAISGPDTAILLGGRITPVPLPRSVRMFLVQGRARLTSGLEVEVASLRLLPPTVCIDLWSPACWREQTANRRARLEQVRAVVQQIAQTPDASPLILGGDFNAPAGDRIYRLLRPRLHDTFGEGGIGWGNTAINDWPFTRIDQVWASEHFRAAAVVARKTQHSDHRMVICDLLLR